MIRKLSTVLRQPLLPLYNTCLQPALQLSSSVLSTVLGKLCDAHNNVEGEGLRAAWDATAEDILSGILVRSPQSGHRHERLTYPTGFPGSERLWYVYLSYFNTNLAQKRQPVLSRVVQSGKFCIASFATSSSLIPAEDCQYSA